MGKLRSDFKLEMNAFSMDISKILQATEILKTRIPFLYQENTLITHIKEVPNKKKEEENETFEKVFSGLSVILSREKFEVSDLVGYQKPKPRQFVQPQLRQKVEEKEPEPPKEESKKQKEVKGKRQRKRATSHQDEESKDEPVHEIDFKGGKKTVNKKPKKKFEKQRSSSDDKWPHDRYDEVVHENRRPPRYRDYDEDAYYYDYHMPPMHHRYPPMEHERRMPPQQVYREVGTRGGRPPAGRGTPGFRGGMTRGGGRGAPIVQSTRGGMRGGGMRGGYNDRQRYFAAKNSFDEERADDRPGFFAAQKGRRNDDRDHFDAYENNHIERERMDRQRQQYRDARNKPNGIAEKFSN